MHVADLDERANLDVLLAHEGGRMPRNYTEFDRTTARAVETQGFATVQRRSTISLNAAAMSQLGNPTAIHLMYDEADQVIGMRPISADDPRGYPVRKQGQSNSFLIAGQAFMRRFNIELDQTRRYPVSVVDGVLEIDLNGPSVDATGPRAATHGTTDATE